MYVLGAIYSLLVLNKNRQSKQSKLEGFVHEGRMKNIIPVLQLLRFCTREHFYW